MTQQSKVYPIILFIIFSMNSFIISVNANEENFLTNVGKEIGILRGTSSLNSDNLLLIDSVLRLMSSASINNESSYNLESNRSDNVIHQKVQGGFSLPSWGGIGFEYRKNITISASNVPSDLTDFPVLIDLNRDSDLFGVQQVNGNDIMFTDVSGVKLDHEIEKFNQIDPRLIAWVKTDLSSSSNNVISMYFGNSTVPNQENPSGVWDSNYIGIYHLTEDPTSTIYDSTVNNHDGTATGMTTSDQVEGQIDGSLDFDGIDDNIGLGQISSNAWTEITLEAWVRTGYTGMLDDRIIAKEEGSGSGPHIWMLGRSNNNLKLRLTTDGSGGGYSELQPSGGLVLGKWQHIAMTWDSGTATLTGYIDGAYRASTGRDGDTITDSTVNVFLADHNYGDRDYSGFLDEARISNTARSANWIATEFANQYDPNSFYAVGQLEGPSAMDFFRYKKTITIDYTKVTGTTDLNDFVILLDIIDPDLHDGDKIESDGSNLIFINPSTNNQLYYEIETFDQNYDSTNGRLVAWVKIDSLSATSASEIDMYYGNKFQSSYLNSENVWSDYEGVWHLNEDAQDEGTVVNLHIDSSINSNNGNQNGNEWVNGSMGLGQNFDGINDYIEMGDPASLELKGDTYYTFSGWFYRESTSSTDVILDKMSPGSIDNSTGYSLWIDGSDGLLHFRTADDDDDGFTLKSTSNFNTQPTGWYHYSITFDTSPAGVSTPANMEIYINGSADNATASLWGDPNPSWSGNDDFNPANNLADFTIGAHSNQTNHFDGRIDEIRITERLLSPDWINTEYNNQYDPQNFYSVSSEVENVDWWMNDSFTLRKDFRIESQNFGSLEEELILRPKDSGNDDHYDVTGALFESSAISETVADDGSSYLYTSVNNSNRYFSYKIDTPPLPFDGTIDKITLYSRARRSGSVISSNYYNYMTWGGSRYYGNYKSLSYPGFTTSSDEWTLNPATGLAWTWKDLVDIEFGARSRIQYTTTCQIQITQMYAIITYTSNKSLWNFPILIDLSDTDLKTDIQANGNDILFYDEVGHKLDHEIVNLVSNSSHANLTTFIKVPQIPLYRDSYISMYYGNQTIAKQENTIDTWDNDFLAVYHFEESPPADTVDITGNYNLTPEVTMNSDDLEAGMVSQALDFDGTDDHLYSTQAITIDSFTVSSWVKFDTGTGWITILNVNRSAEIGGIFRDFAIENSIPVFDDNSKFSFGNALSTSTWYHITFSYDSFSSALKCYVNGVPTGTTVYRDIQSVTDNFQIGAWNLDDYFNGLIDEVRISDVSRSAVWTSLEYSNQLNPTNFITFGGEFDRAPPIVNEFGVDDPGDGSPTFWANVTDQDSVSSVTIELNGSSSSMNLNGSGIWTYQPTSTNFNDYYEYTIRNATDNVGNYLKFASPVENITFDYDTINPSVIDWEYYDSLGPYGTFKANVSDNWGLIDGVIVNVTYHEVLGSLNSSWAIMVNTTSGYMNNSIDLQQGSVNFTIRVNDTGGNVYISPEHIGYFLNTPPLVENVTLSSDPSSEVLPVTSNGTIYVLYDYDDIEDDIESGTEINWYRWNTTHWEFKSADENLTSGWLVKGEVWRVTVKPQDDAGDFGEIVISGNITIQNSAPVASNVIIYPNNPKTDNILNAYYDWADTDPGDSQQIPKTVNGTIIQWYRNRGGGFTLLNAYTNETQIPIAETLKGDIFYYNVTPSDGDSYGNQFKSSEITIQNTLPILTIYILNNTEWITSPVTINDTTALETNNTNFDADPADTLIGLEISWMKYNFVLSKFEWVVNNTKILNPGNTTDGDIWIVNMRIDDGTGYSEWFASSSIRIGTALIPNQLPSAVSVNLTSSNNVTGGFLFANYTFSDPDGDNEGSFTQFKWFKWDNSSNKWVYQSQFSEVTRNLTIAQFIKGDKWKVSVRPQDNNTDYGSWSINSSEMIIGNTAPFIVSAGIVPSSNVYTTDILLANWLGDDVNNDLIILYSIVWINDSIEVSSLTNETEVPSSYTRKGQMWIFKIKLWDGEAWSANYTTTPIDILNSLIRLENVTLSGGTNTLVDVAITYDWVDFDGDTIDTFQTKVNWTVERGGQEVAKINDTWILDNTNFVAGDFVTIQITPHDGSELGEIWAAFRVRITIGNAEPVIDGIPNILDPADGTVFYASNQLFANYSASDPDTGESNVIYELNIDGNGLVVGAEYQWFREGVLVSELTSSFIPISYLVRGDTWKFGVRPKDSWGDFGDWVNSSQIIIINSPPVITEFHQINLETRSDMDFEIEFIYFDFDEDQFNTTKTLILWYRNGSLIPGTENETVLSAIPSGNEIDVRLYLSRDYYSRGDNISVTVRPYDSFEWALQANSSVNTTIVNSLPYFDDVLLIGGDNTSVDINLNLTFIDFDNDLIDLISTEINWFKYVGGMGSPIPLLGELTLLSGNFSAGDEITVEITPHDGIDFGTPWEILKVRKRVGNAIPSIVGIPNILGVNDSTLFYSSELLVLNYSAADPDVNSSFIYNLEYDEEGFVIGAEYLWYRNNTLVSELTTPYVNNSYLVRGDVWNVSVRVRDRYGDYGNWINSTVISIINSPPRIIGIFEVISNLTTNLDLEFDFIYSDFDNDTINLSKLLILWYRNGTLLPGAENKSIISQTPVGNDTRVRISLSNIHYNRDDNLTVIIRPSDGYDWAFRNVTSLTITVVNYIPIIQLLNVKPNGSDITAYTTDTLNITWNSYDADGDKENASLTFIKWYKFVGVGYVEQTNFRNKTSIPSNATTKDDIWYIYIQVSDGYGYSIGNSSVPINIYNSPPVISSFMIGNIINQTADLDLIIILNQDINASDSDNDTIIGTSIHWYKNNSHQSQFDDETTIPSSALFKGDEWFAIVSIRDVEDWSLDKTSQTVLIINKAPTILSVNILGEITQEFLVVDEEITLALVIEDIDQGDTDVSTIKWYVDGDHMPMINNQRTISSNLTQAGENWRAVIIPYDGFNFGIERNLTFQIESRPLIQNFIVELEKDTEGEYEFSLKVHDSLNNSIIGVRFEVFLNGSTSSIVDTTRVSPNGTGYWVLDYSLSDYSFINTEAIVRISATSEVEYSQIYTISRIELFNFTLLDEAAPRVINSWVILNDERNPTNITFNAEIEEFGSGIANVILYYTFKTIEGGNETAAGIGASVFQNEYESSMIFQRMTGNVYVYSVTVDFIHNNTDKEILYHIATEDLEGNSNEAAWDNIRDDIPEQFIYQSPSIPEWVILLGLLAIVAIFFGSVVYVRFIRKPELVGLDKDLVTKNIKNISEAQISGSLDSHTIGVVVSFFDQAQGPIPIIVIPEMLKDNFSKLLELSDRSFSGTGFADTFDVEIPSSYDFVLDRGVRISAMSFGLSLERPEARGGQENLTINILIHQDVYPLLNQFQDEVKAQVHELHMLMNDPATSGDKNLIRGKVFGLRKYITMIALAYQELYGTTDLLSEDDE